MTINTGHFRVLLTVAIVIACIVAELCTATAGTIVATNRFAWAENAGWWNFAPTNAGVIVEWGQSGYLSGYVWAENIGMIKLGNDNGGPYQNSTADNWGVNIAASKLSGYAWSETCGWINFNPSHSQVVIDPGSGRFDGYAWSENVGWIHFKNTAPTYNVQTEPRLPQGTLIFMR